MSDIEARVKKIIAEQLACPRQTSPTRNPSSPTWAPTRSTPVELVMALEDEFGIEIPDEEAEKITTVQLGDRLRRQHQKAA